MVNLIYHYMLLFKSVFSYSKIINQSMIINFYFTTFHNCTTWGFIYTRDVLLLKNHTRGFESILRSFLFLNAYIYICHRYFVSG